MTRDRDYWRRRSEQVALMQYDRADRYAERLLKEYQRAIRRIERDIEAFYARYAVENQVTLAEARRLLSNDELAEFRMTLEEFIERAKNNVDGRWTRQLNAAYYKVRISRLDSLLLQIRGHAEELLGNAHAGTQELLAGIYEDTYYRTIYEVQRGLGIGVSFATLDRPTIEKAIMTPWLGENYSARIWANRDKLVRELQTKLTQAFIRGEGVAQTAKDLAERMQVSYSSAERIVRTESSFVTHQATWDGYKASGVVDRFEFLATLDGRTSEICRDMDGRVFRLSEKEVGVNYPPLHPNCRSTVVPYFDDEEDPGERIARDEEGQTYYVPGDMKYQEWYDRYVKSNQAFQESSTGFISDARNEFNKWDKQNVEEFANKILAFAGLNHLKARRRTISAHGQCLLIPHSDKLQVQTYELNLNDNREIQYQIKTVFHELFHAKAHNLTHDIHKIGFQQWAYIDDVFAESFSHYMLKQIGITEEIAPSYAGYLVETLPKLKTLPEFKDAKKISDFGEKAYEYRLGSSSKAEWSDLYKRLNSLNFDISQYSQQYLSYIQNHSGELIDKMLENMPDYKMYRSNMLKDLDSAIDLIHKRELPLTGNEKLIFENVMILAMNRLGVNGL